MTLQIEGALQAADLRQTGEAARKMEAQGFDGLLSFESAHDPFLPLAAAAEHTSRVRLTTAVAIAFARNPMVCAYLANDLQLLSGGRFVLGLGTQIRLRERNAWAERTSLVLYDETDPEAVADLVRAFKTD